MAKVKVVVSKTEFRKVEFGFLHYFPNEEDEMEKRLMNVKELSVYLSMPVPTIYTYVCMGKIPPQCIKRIGRALRFDIKEIDAWIGNQAQTAS